MRSDGICPLRAGATALDGGGPWIVGNGGREREIEPLKHFPELYARFANLGDDPREWLDFAGNFGRLSWSDRDDFYEWRSGITTMRSFASPWKSSAKDLAALLWRNPEWRLTRLETRLRPATRSGPIRLVMTPESLHSALRLQFGLAVASGRSIGSCERCGRWFETGAGSERKLGAKYCSTACRVTFNNAKKGS
jgi:hypothetical protein